MGDGGVMGVEAGGWRLHQPKFVEDQERAVDDPAMANDNNGLVLMCLHDAVQRLPDPELEPCPAFPARGNRLVGTALVRGAVSGIELREGQTLAGSEPDLLNARVQLH